MESEMCSGCGLVSPSPFPFIAVVKDESEKQFIAIPVCTECWQHPEHRKVPLKGHFFPRAMETAALAAAGSTNLGG